MKKISENLAIMIIISLSMSILYLIIQYNLIDDDSVYTKVVKNQTNPEVKEEKKVTKASNYLENLEGYTDVDVKVDAKIEDDNVNKVSIVSESNINEIELNKVVDSKDGTKADEVGKALDNLMDDL